MSISFCEKNFSFKLDTPDSSYVIAIFSDEKIPAHVYYGERLDTHDLNHLIDNEPYYDASTPLASYRNKGSVMDRLPFEYPSAGLGDYRETGLIVHDNEGRSGVLPSYVSHKIYKGKNGINGLPATFGGEDDCETLELICRDEALSLDITLFYTVFKNIDAITRHAKIENSGDASVTVKRAYSASLELPCGEYDIIRLYGSWARERTICRTRLGHGTTGMASTRGISSHQTHPFIALLDKDATQDSGRVYGLHLVYSGNFAATADLSQFERVRALIGINDYNFSWELKKGEKFETPEAVLTFSARGLGKMSQSLHDLYRNHLIRGKYKDTARPILINNWEATYFDFNTEKLLAIAKDAAECGIELFVLDDGWFGKRDSDNSSLGDWTVNEEKLPGGLGFLAREIKKLGMDFGIWMEPEMISPDSDLYRAHPDWALSLPNRAPVRAREQYVLDITREDVREYIWQCIKKTLDSADITYLKWDMNRPLTDTSSAVGENGELYHRYVLGLYELQERLVREYPHVLLENCSGGGGRFDPGMLYYSPQIWASDDTDAIERLVIQEGTALIYPLSSIGAHVSICPNHTTGRTTPFETRGIAALFGTFGYELDITKLSQEEKSQIPAQVEMYKKYNALIRNGDYYRLASYSQNNRLDAWQIVSKDKSESLIAYFYVRTRPNAPMDIIRPQGLDETGSYTCEETGKTYTARALMYGGLPIKSPGGDYRAKIIYLKK